MVLRAVEMATWQRQSEGAVILRSDRGSQFRRGDYQRFLERSLPARPDSEEGDPESSVERFKAQSGTLPRVDRELLA